MAEWQFTGISNNSVGIELDKKCLDYADLPLTNIFTECELKGCPGRYEEADFDCVYEITGIDDYDDYGDDIVLTCTQNGADGYKLEFVNGSLTLWPANPEVFVEKESLGFTSNVYLWQKTGGVWKNLYSENIATFVDVYYSPNFYIEDGEPITQFITSAKIYTGDVDADGDEDIVVIFNYPDVDDESPLHFSAVMVFYNGGSNYFVHSDFDEQGVCTGPHKETPVTVEAEEDVVSAGPEEVEEEKDAYDGSGGCSTSPSSRPSCIRWDGECIGDIIWDTYFNW